MRGLSLLWSRALGDVGSAWKQSAPCAEVVAGRLVGDGDVDHASSIFEVEAWAGRQICIERFGASSFN